MKVNENTVYIGNVKTRTIEDENKFIELAALPSIGDVSISNVIINIADKNKKDTEYAIIMDYIDAVEFVGELISVKDARTSCAFDFDTVLSKLKRTKYIIEIEPAGDSLAMVYKDLTNKSNEVLKFGLSNYIIDQMANTMKLIYEDACKLHESNDNLAKQLLDLKNDMKKERVKKLYFDVYDDAPELCSKAYNHIVKIYKISALDENGIALYAFLLYMHLTGLVSVDYESYGKQFLGCPFEYSDRLKDMGKAFIEKKQSELKDFVDNKTNKVQS